MERKLGPLYESMKCCMKRILSSTFFWLSGLTHLFPTYPLKTENLTVEKVCIGNEWNNQISTMLVLCHEIIHLR